MQDILGQLVKIYRAQGAGAVREQLKQAELPDEQIELFIAKVERRILAEDAPQHDESSKMMKLITADYLQNGEALVRTRLKDSGMDDEAVHQIMVDVKLLAQVEMQKKLKELLKTEGEDALRAVLRQQGADDASIETLIGLWRDEDGQ